MPLVEFFFRKAGKVFNFTKERLHLLVPLGIWKIFTAYITVKELKFYKKRIISKKSCVKI